jgi:hypothetical protein
VGIAPTFNDPVISSCPPISEEDFNFALLCSERRPTKAELYSRHLEQERRLAKCRAAAVDFSTPLHVLAECGDAAQRRYDFIPGTGIRVTNLYPRQNRVKSKNFVPYVRSVPAPRLVCVESNPGPPNPASSQAILKMVQSIVTKHPDVTHVSATICGDDIHYEFTIPSSDKDSSDEEDSDLEVDSPITVSSAPIMGVEEFPSKYAKLIADPQKGNAACRCLPGQLCGLHTSCFEALPPFVSNFASPPKEVPAPRLVGIEPNPGPQGKTKKLAKKMVAMAIAKPSKSKKLKRSLTAAALRPRQAGFKGHGDYREIIDDLGGVAKKAVGQLGSWLSGKAMSLFGMGDYSSHESAGTLKLDDSKIESNSLIVGTSPPTVRNRGQAFVFRHREYVADVQPSVNFQVSSYKINPGNSALFPWLSGLSDGFEEYQITGMLVEYKPLVSAVSANSIGAVVISTEYNPTKPNFTTKAQMENYEYATSCAPHHCMLHAIECNPQETVAPHKQILFGSVPSGQDPRFYYWANMQVATQGQANTTGVIGELWVTYEILCYKPIFAIGQGLNLLSDHYAYLISGNNVAVLTPSTTNALVPRPGSLLGTTISTNGTITFPSNITTGYYLVTVSLACATGFANSCNLIAASQVLANCAFVNMYTAGGVPGQSPLPGATTSSWVVATQGNATTTFVLSINAPSATQASIQLATTINLTGATNFADVVITQLNGSLT